MCVTTDKIARISFRVDVKIILEAIPAGFHNESH